MARQQQRRTLLAMTSALVAGRMALWTKADSVTHFDDLTIKPL